jgi:hypothetical protein
MPTIQDDTATIRQLTGAELDAVSGGEIPLRGYGAPRLNISPFSVNAPLDPAWELRGLPPQPPG